MNLSSLVISLIRQYVPVAVGVVLTWIAVSLKIVIDPSTGPALIALTTAILTAAYYLLVRLLERKWPVFGILLGVPAQPAYVKPGEHEAA